MVIRRLGAFLTFVMFSCAYFNTFYNAKVYFKEAETLYKERGPNPVVQKKYRKVIEKCSKILDRYPESKYIDDALYLMAISYMRLGEKQKARRKFEELFTFYPKSQYKRKALLDYSSLLISIGDYDSARSVIRRIQDDERDNVRLVLANLAFKEGNYNAVIRMGREFLKKKTQSKTSKDFLNLAADAALKVDSLEAAKEFLSALIQLNLSPQERFRVNILYLDFLLKRNQPDTALNIIMDLRFPPESEENRLLSIYKSRFLLQKGDTSKAKSTLREIIKMRRSDSIKIIATYELARIFEEEDSLSIADSLYKSIMYSSYTPIAKKARERENVIRDIITLTDSSDCVSLSRVAELYLFHLGRIESSWEKYRQVFEKCKGIERERALYALIYIALLRNDRLKALEIIKEYPCDSISDTLKSIIRESLNFTFQCQRPDTLR